MTLTIIGAGNVAWHLSQALQKAGHTIEEVFSRTEESANELADVLKCKSLSDIGKINTQSSLYIIAVADDAITAVVDSMPDLNGVVCHTAGGVSMDVLQKFKNHGVFYPFQTFSKQKKVDFKEVPICLEADNAYNLSMLQDVAFKISNQVCNLDTEQRSELHVAAVFACNFANHMYALANDILKKSSISRELLYPLITETANKAVNFKPKEVQTGPAIRRDENVMEKHLQLLKDSPNLQAIYKQLSNSIRELD